MPVEFLSDAEAAAYGRFDGCPSREELDRVFFLDDADRELIGKRRGAPNQLGFALQLTTVRWLGTFLPDPTDVPPVVLAYVGRQLEIKDPSCVVRYLERRRTRFEHAQEIRASEALRDFAVVTGEFEEWLAARAYMTGDGPRAIFADATGWLRGQQVLLPGVTTLARLVARARSDGDRRLWETLAAVPTGLGRVALDALLDVAEGARTSELERARRGPADPTGTNLKLALHRVRDVHEVGVDGERARALVPARRLAELARYGLQAKAPRLRRHPPVRRIATLVATLAHLQAASIDDCLELFDLLMVTELLGKAERASNKQRAREHPRLARASAKLARVVGKLLEASSSEEMVRVSELWHEIETVASREELRSAIATVDELVPHSDEDDEGDVRERLSERIRMVSGFLRELCEVIELGSNAEGEPVLREMRRMPWLLDRRRKLKAQDINDSLVRGSWRRLVYGQQATADGLIDRNAYVFCVLTQFHRHLKRRDVYAPRSSRWRDPRAQLLSGEAWENAKGPVLRALGLPEDPTKLIDSHARSLDAAYRQVASRIDAGTEVTVDDEGRLHFSALEAIPDPPSLIQLRKLVQVMLPRIGLPEVIVEVMSWLPGFVGAFTSVSGGRTRLEDLHVSIAACLAAHAWPDILRVIASIYTGTVRAYDVTRVLQRDGNPTPFGEAIQHYGRIHKSLHILHLIDDESYRRDVKWMRNLQEGRHALARKVFHGSKGELYQRYREGMEDQLGALGLVLNCIVLWNTVYINAALQQLRASGYPVLDVDMVRLHPLMRRHLAVQGDYSFMLPALDGRLRELRDPTEGQDEGEDEDEEYQEH